MQLTRRIQGLVFLGAAAWVSIGLAQAPRTSEPLSEAKIVRMIELKIKDPVIVSMIQKQGVGFTIDDPAIERLKQAGAPVAVLDAIRKAGSAKPAPGADPPVTFRAIKELLELGVPESEILDRLKQSPTTFTLSVEQVEELKGLGATEPVLKAMASVRASVDAASELSNLVIVLDCSGSMSERTPDGRTKMEAGREAAVKLVQELPEGLRLAFVVYGHDRTKECNAVEVVRPLGVLNPDGKGELIRLIGRLQPVGSTPIALALRAAGQELGRSNAPSGVVLISDGKEMCGGDPASEAATLTRNLKLDSGVQVVGFGVKPDEKRALEEIARNGKGKYYDAPTPTALRDVIPMLAKKLQQAAKPAPVGERLTVARRGLARLITVQSPAIELPPIKAIYVTEKGSIRAQAVDYHAFAKGLRYDQPMRIPPANKAEVFDLWLVPKDQQSLPVKLVADLAVGLDQAETVVKPEDHLGLVRLTGKGLPTTKEVFLGPPNYGSEVAGAIGPHKLQKVSKYGQDLVVPAGTYNLWIDPTDETKPEVIAEKVEVKAGKVVVIE